MSANALTFLAQISVKKVQHDLFDVLWLYQKGNYTRWEAEYNIDSEHTEKKIYIMAQDNYDLEINPEPSEQEMLFVKQYIDTPKLLFSAAKEGIENGWKEVFNEDVPQIWESEVRISGFTVPVAGDSKNIWQIIFSSKKINDDLIMVLEDGKSSLFLS